jgi:hypothetical protein
VPLGPDPIGHLRLGGWLNAVVIRRDGTGLTRITAETSA